jgi:hypothetical protein
MDLTTLTLRTTALLVFVVVLVPSGAAALPLPDAPNCPVFPRNNPWNQRVDALPAAKRSDTFVNWMGAGDPLYADFYMPYVSVGAHQRRVPVSFFYGSSSDRGPYPIPPNPPVEPGTPDRHVLIVDRARCKLYELYKARKVRGRKRWKAGSGATWNLRSNHLRPYGWTSADAGGLPILPGLARYDEVARGVIDHAIRVTAHQVRDTFVYPARHSDGRSSSNKAPPMGTRIRLKASFDLTPFPPQAQVILRALQQYGMIIADSGAPWFINGTPSENWDRSQLETLGSVKGLDFEVVDTSSLPKPGLKRKHRR